MNCRLHKKYGRFTCPLCRKAMDAYIKKVLGRPSK